MMLTAKERKKIKRIKKTEKQKEEQDKIRLGLIQAPGLTMTCAYHPSGEILTTDARRPYSEPKMRLSNLMRVLGNDAIMEPSKMEVTLHARVRMRPTFYFMGTCAQAKVRSQMAERLQAHQAHNDARSALFAAPLNSTVYSRKGRVPLDSSCSQGLVGGGQEGEETQKADRGH